MERCQLHVPLHRIHWRPRPDRVSDRAGGILGNGARGGIVQREQGWMMGEKMDFSGEREVKLNFEQLIGIFIKFMPLRIILGPTSAMALCGEELPW